MAEQCYRLADAMKDMREQGLLEELLIGDSDGWRKVPAQDAGEIDGAFLGAGMDSRFVEPGQLFLGLDGEKLDGRDFAGRAFASGASAVLTRSWDGPGPDPLLELPPGEGCVVFLSRTPRSAFTHLAGSWRWQKKLLLIGVTGTNGKTTTKDFLASLLAGAGSTLATAGNLNNELGVPLTLFRLRDKHEYAVIEMGASAVGDIARLGALARPRIGVITNAAEAHLSCFGSLDDVVVGKGELLDALPDNGVAVLNADSPGYRRWMERAHCRVLSLGQNSGDVRWTWRCDTGSANCWLDLGNRKWRVPLPGIHNAANLGAAIVAGGAAGLSHEEMWDGLRDFEASPHRSRLLEVGGLQLLDDSYNANPTSMLAAAAGMEAVPGGGRTIAVLGAMAELGDASEALHQDVGRRLIDTGLDLVLSVGDDAAALAEGFASAGGSALALPTRRDAVQWLCDNTIPGDRVLIKGSRSAGMEEVVRGLRGHYEELD